MRLRSAAWVLGGIVVAGHRGGLADSQSAGLSIQVVVARSCSVNTAAPNGLAITCSRGTPPVQTSSSFTSAPLGRLSAATLSDAPLPQRTVTASATREGQAVSGNPAAASIAPGASNRSAADATAVAPPAPTDGVDSELAAAGPARQQWLTINF